MTVSIIIGTRNREESLRSTLASIARTAVPRGWDVELLVVDNGSTAHTAAIVSEAQLSNMELRCIREPTPGVSHAKNAGLREASGEAILFTDDDVRVPIDWIGGMCRKIIDGQADAVAGGVVFPPALDLAINSGPFRNRRTWLGSTEDLDPQHPVRMVGANMAIHRRVLGRVPGFDVELGPGARGFGEETLFSWQLRAAGYNLIGALGIAVEHHFDSKRLTGEGIRATALKMVRTQAFLAYHWEHRRLRLALPRLVLWRLRRRWARFMQWFRNDREGDAFARALRTEEVSAFYAEYLAQRCRRHKYPLHGRAPIRTEFKIYSADVPTDP